MFNYTRYNNIFKIQIYIYNNNVYHILVFIKKVRAFLGSLMVKSPCFHCQRHGFNFGLGNWDPTSSAAQPRNIKILKMKKKRKVYSDGKFTKLYTFLIYPILSLLYFKTIVKGFKLISVFIFICLFMYVVLYIYISVIYIHTC